MRLVSWRPVKVMALRGIDVIITALSLRLMTELLAPSEYAIVILFQTVIQGWVWLTVSPLQNYLFRRVASEAGDGRLPRAVAQAAVIVSISSFSALPFAYAVSELSVIPLDGPSPQTIALVIFGIFGSALSSFIVPLLNFGGRSMTYSLFQLTLTATGIVVAVALAYMLGASAGGWVLGMAAGQLIVSAILIRMLGLRMNTIRVAAKRLFRESRQIRIFVLPLLASMPFQWYFVQGFRFNLEDMFGLEAFAFFMVGFFLPGKFFNALEKVLNVGFVPAIYAAEGRDSRANAWLKFAFVTGCMCVVLGGALWAFEEAVFSIFVASEYHAAKIFFGFGVISETLRIGTNVAQTFLLATQRTRLIFWTTAITSTCLLAALTANITNDPLSVAKILIGLNFLAIVITASAGLWVHWENRNEH